VEEWNSTSKPSPAFPKGFERALKGSIGILGVGISLFHLYTGAFGTLEAYSQRFIHLLTLMTISFLVYPASRSWSDRRNTLSGIP